MARDCYETTVAVADATGTLKVLSGVKVSVVPRDAVDVVVGASAVDIFQKATGTAKGPDPATGATGTNPITTSASGAVRFWAEGPVEYDIVFEDTQAPARINDRTGWNAIPAKAGAIPTNVLREDGGITQKMLTAEVVRQQIPIGGVIDWWRPSSVVDPPGGYEICDGRVISQHDFIGVTGSIQMPDTRNSYILGADVAKADTTPSNSSELTTGGPGIRGVGGFNQVKLLIAQMPLHNHGATGPMSANAVHNHNAGVTDPIIASSGGEALVGWLSGPAAYGVKSVQSNVYTPDRNLDHTHSTNPSGNDQPHPNMPKYIGLLKIMKVRRY